MKNVIIIILMVCINPTAFAHVGSHSSNIAIKVIEAQFDENSANVSLTLSNKGADDLTIESIVTSVGKVSVNLDYPLVIRAGNAFHFKDELSLFIKSNQSIPQIFTLDFDFKHAGSGPVTIIPTSFRSQ